MTGSGEGGSYNSVTGGKCPFIYLGEGVYSMDCLVRQGGPAPPRFTQGIHPSLQIGATSSDATLHSSNPTGGHEPLRKSATI